MSDKTGDEQTNASRRNTEENDIQNKNLDKLCEYVNQMSFKPGEPVTATPYIEKLGKPKGYKLIDTYQEFHDVLQPKGRQKRFQQKVHKLKTITTDQMEDLIRKQRTKEAADLKIKKKKEILYYETLSNLERQCREQFLNALVKKFAKFLAARAVNQQQPLMQTENYRRLQKSILCNIYMTLGIPMPHDSEEKINDDYDIYSKLSYTLADLIINAMFMAKNPDEYLPVIKEVDIFLEDEEGECANWDNENRKKDKCIKIRALRAATKKLCRKSVLEKC